LCAYFYVNISFHFFGMFTQNCSCWVVRIVACLVFLRNKQTLFRSGYTFTFPPAISEWPSFPYFFFFFEILGFELRAYTLSHPTSLFWKGFFEIGARESPSSWSLPPE
jgi:hypothetical protein